MNTVPRRARLPPLSMLCKHRNRHKWLKSFLKWKRPLIRMFIGHFCSGSQDNPVGCPCVGNCIRITAHDIVTDEMNYRFLHRGLWNNAFIGFQSSAPLFPQL
ncbi:hypothetical protein CDAR_265391 [Caerostris darwini]|uniref:Uncharacterized protein n=1 Tax=Caerostris darwini TaxID=1538125 RepID=A0AAV4NIU2_9ARAC|nr:hypothetical protein CDAR_265391 [Caerostris darwini]